MNIFISLNKSLHYSIVDTILTHRQIDFWSYFFVMSDRIERSVVDSVVTSSHPVLAGRSENQWKVILVLSIMSKMQSIKIVVNL